MSASYAVMFGFGLLLLGSWAGWGAAIHRVLFRRIPANRALHAGWGLAFTLVVGGVLNLMRAVTPTAIYAFSAAGLSFLLADNLRRRRRLREWVRGLALRTWRDWLLAAATAVLCGLLIVLYGASVRTTVFNFHDDLQGYFVFPTKMIQTGSLGPDPFSERRILSLGGMSFLHACILSVADLRCLGIIDAGIGLLLCAALLWAIARDARTNAWARSAGLLLFLLIPPVRVNTTSVLTGLALFLTLFLTLDRVSLRRRLASHGIVPVALVAAGLCILKTTFLPAAVLLIVGAAVSELTHARREWGAACQRLAFVGGLALLLCAPWMVSLYYSNGTLLYPFLGRGFHGSAYGTFWQPAAGVTFRDVGPLLFTTLRDRKILPLFLLGAVPFLRRDLAGRRGVLVAWFLAATVSIFAMRLALGGGFSSYRYTYSFLYATIFTLLLFAFPDSAADGARRGARVLLGGLAIAVLLLAHAWKMGAHLRSQLESGIAGVRMSRELVMRPIRWSTREVVVTPYAQSYAKMQLAVPKGAVLLTRLQYPFLLDFRRNTVFIADYPGGSSPPPGMPFFQGGEAPGRVSLRAECPVHGLLVPFNSRYTQEGPRVPSPVPGGSMVAHAGAAHSGFPERPRRAPSDTLVDLRRRRRLRARSRTVLGPTTAPLHSAVGCGSRGTGKDPASPIPPQLRASPPCYNREW